MRIAESEVVRLDSLCTVAGSNNYLIWHRQSLWRLVFTLNLLLVVVSNWVCDCRLIPDPFSFLRFRINCCRIRYEHNLTMIPRFFTFSLGFLASFFSVFFPTRWLRSMSVVFRSIFMLFATSHMSWSVLSPCSSAMPKTRMQFLLEYCSNWLTELLSAVMVLHFLSSDDSRAKILPSILSFSFCRSNS